MLPTNINRAKFNIIEVITRHNELEMLPETLFLSIFFLDCLIYLTNISLEQYIAYIDTAILLASKFVCTEFKIEITPTMKFLETEMIKLLGFKMNYPGPLYFLTNICKKNKTNTDVLALAEYILLVIAVNKDYCEYKPSILAAGVYCFSYSLIYKTVQLKVFFFSTGAYNLANVFRI